ncbi:MAG: biotin-dependent carboxyltransferase family protein [Congregibacter sp.]
MTELQVVQPGLLSLIQDAGRTGKARLGLTVGGPMDPVAAALANRLLRNAAFDTFLELSYGGLHLRTDKDIQFCVTGAPLSVAADDREMSMWRVETLYANETLNLGFSEVGCRSYIAFRGGLAVQPSFGSAATVVREHIGGLRGLALKTGDVLRVSDAEPTERLWIAPRQRPLYQRRRTVRVVEGYQHAHFPRLELRRFYSSDYTISQQSDRMGYRLEGPEITCDLQGILSEGIAPGAIQVPADGQPIILLNDRQTIGGYPKLGSALSIDCAALAQLRPGDTVNFAAVSAQTAHNALHLATAFERARRLELAPA